MAPSQYQALMDQIRARHRVRKGGLKRSALLGPLRHAKRWAKSLLNRRADRQLDAVAMEEGTTGLIRAVPEFRGEFELDPRSHITKNLFKGGFEKGLPELVEALVQEGDHVVDVGANMGLYTVLLGKLVGSGKVLAVEPTAGAFAFLEANLKRNHLDNVILFQGVCGAESGTQTLHFVEGYEEYSSLSDLTHPNAPAEGRREVGVASETLDRLVDRHQLKPAFLKVDVEGAEGLVFSGAKQILANHRPVVLSELDDRLLASFSSRAAEVLDLFWQAAYRSFDVKTGAELTKTNTPEPFVGEFIAFPKEGFD